MLRIALPLFALVWAVGAASPCGVAADQSCAPRHNTYDTGYGGGYGIEQTGYASEMEDSAERYASGLESWWDDLCDCIRARRLRGYKRTQRSHRKFLYPECPPACSPTFGYHHTQWRQFPECDYVWTSAPATTAWPTPVAPPATLAPVPAVAPDFPQSIPAPPPYFPEPESAPLIQPLEPAVPPAPPAEPPQDAADQVYLPARPADAVDEYDVPVLLEIAPN